MRPLIVAWLLFSAALPAHAALPAELTSHRVGTLTLATDLPSSEGEDLAHRVAVARRLISHRIEKLLERSAPLTDLTVVLWRRAEDWEAFTRRHAPERLGSGAWYDGERGWIVTHQLGHSDSTLCHELVHEAVGALTDDPRFTRYARPDWPVWLEEGLAEALGQCRLHGNPVTVQGPQPEHQARILSAQADGHLPDLAAIKRWRADDFSGPASGLRYAVAALAASALLESDPGRAAIRGALLDGTALAPGALVIPGTFASLARQDLRGDASVEWILHGGGRIVRVDGALRIRRESGEAFATRAFAPATAWTLAWRGRFEGRSASISLGDHASTGDRWILHVDLDSEGAALRFEGSTPIVRIPGSALKGDIQTLRLRGEGSSIRVRYGDEEIRLEWPGAHRVSRIGLGIDSGSLTTEALHIEERLSDPSGADARDEAPPPGPSAQDPDPRSSDN
jgi:hypothetical protein